MRNNLLRDKNSYIIGSALLTKISALITLCMLFIQLQGQQIPVYSAYYFNKYLINPGFTGIDNEFRAFGFYRTQWSSLSGRPVTGGATAEATCWKDRIGIGGFVVNDQIGIFHRINGALSYAQKFQLAKGHQISIGIQGGVFTNRIDFAKATVADLNDPGLLEQNPIKTVFDMSAGVGYKWKGLLLGFAALNLTQPLAKYATPGLASNYEYVRHYTAFGQYRIQFLQGKFNITPQLLMRKGPATGYQFDAMAMLDYKNIVFLGGGYRNAFGAIGIAGVNVFNMFTIAVAYDYTTQPLLAGQVGSTAEVTAGFHLSGNYKSKKKLEAMAALQHDTIWKLQKRTDSLTANIDSTTKALDSTTAEVKTLKKANDSLIIENNSYKKLLDSLSEKLDQLLSLQRLNNENNPDGNSYRLDKIYFPNKKYNLLPQSETQLNALASFMKRFPKIHILIIGYTDNAGGDAFNDNLSMERAKAVADYLIENGVNGSRIEFEGMGSSNPVGDNTTEEGRRLNRRVEFTIEK